MKNILLAIAFVVFSFSAFAQPTVNIQNPYPFDVLIELGWHDNTNIPFNDCHSHASQWICLAPSSFVTINSPRPQYNVFKGFKVYCGTYAGCTGNTYTDGGPWADPGVAVIWHCGHHFPSGTIDHFLCTGTYMGTSTWTPSFGSPPFPFCNYDITL